jgi:hypothetical protein
VSGTLRSTLILSFHLPFGLQSGHFLEVSPSLISWSYFIARDYLQSNQINVSKIYKSKCFLRYFGVKTLLSYMSKRGVSIIDQWMLLGFHWREPIARNKTVWSHVFEWPDLTWHIPHDVPTLLVTRRPCRFRKHPHNCIGLQDVQDAIQCCVIKRTDDNVFTCWRTYFDNKLRKN